MAEEAYDIFYTVFCQRRPGRLNAVLDLILRQLRAKAGINAFVVLVPDRPTKDVERVIATYLPNPRIHVHTPSTPIMSPEYGQRWTAIRNESADAFDALGHTARWWANMDDDWLYGPGWDDPDIGLPHCLQDAEGVGSWRAISLFVWGRHWKTGQAMVNTRQHHNSPLFGRYERGWRRDPNMTNQVAAEVEDRVKAGVWAEETLKFYLVDCGTISQAERRKLYCDYAQAGKFDDYTKRYILPPRLMSLTDVYRRFPEPQKYYEMQCRQLVREQANDQPC